VAHQLSDNRVLLSTAEAGATFGLSQAYIEWLLRHQRVEGFKTGRDWLVYQDSLAAFVAQPRKPGPKPKRDPAEAE
jgi:hypothetical protein